MSLFRPFFNTTHSSNQNDLFSLLNLLEEPVNRPQSLRRRLAETQQTLTFAPKFDIKETKTGYELHGELPGIEQKNVEIEWSEGNVLSIHGRTEYNRTEGDAPEKVQEEGWETTEAQGHDTAPATGSEKTEVAKTPAAGEVAAEKPKPKPTSRYWITERSVGEFHRSFSFPTLVDQENVKASLKNGVLSVIIPKKAKQEVRRIQVE
ncbi:HSP20-like chaperone [Lophium mytilinum]|uniref:HSP20-like chaperone n=1 Tax=Lophium mytilinum TaxID=390894 RepID=A0A6A6R3N0_9PEZI|nr:HSP20-like chaperone [Lophium mytilinum]